MSYNMKHIPLLLVLLVLANSSKTDLVFDLFKTTNGYIFEQMRMMKQGLPTKVQIEIENYIKQYEYRYLSNKEDFVDFILDKFYEVRYNYEEEKILDHTEIHDETFQFMQDFLKFYNGLTLKEKKTIDTLIEEQETYVKNILNYAKDNHPSFNDEDFSNIGAIIEKIPGFILGEKDKENNLKINNNFQSFIEMITNEYDLNEVRKFPTIRDKKKKLEEITKSIKHDHHKDFSSFLQEYIHESIINNEEFKKKYTQKVINEKTISKIINTNKVNSISSSRFTQTEPSQETKTDGGEIAENLKKGVGRLAGIMKGVLKPPEKKKTILKSCDNVASELKNEIDDQMNKLKDSFTKSLSDLKEFPVDILEGAGNLNLTKMIGASIIKQFIKKLITLVISHIPFFFFKICIPPGPFVLGCCPEVALLPQQLYNVFTAFDKVERFKQVAKNYPQFLTSIGRDKFSVIEYYICAQSAMTLHMSALFNICNPLTLIWTNPQNYLGLNNGDLPMCFVTCIQAAAMCRTNPFNFGPCDALVNIQTIIMSIFIIPLRLRLIHSFIMVCTYVPFLIRWDLIPPYITDKSSPGPGKQEQDSPPEVIDTGLNCKKEEPKKEAPSPFEQELDKDTLNQIKTEPLNFHVEDDEEERGVPVFTAFEINDRIRVIDFKKDYDLGKIISNSNSATDVISTLNTPNSNEMIYHIYNYKDACSISKRGDFPYHVRSILINNWEPNKIKRK